MSSFSHDKNRCPTHDPTGPPMPPPRGKMPPPPLAGGGGIESLNLYIRRFSVAVETRRPKFDLVGESAITLNDALKIHASTFITPTNKPAMCVCVYTVKGFSVYGVKSCIAAMWTQHKISYLLSKLLRQWADQNLLVLMALKH